jgi:hypothetical protein
MKDGQGLCPPDYQFFVLLCQWTVKAYAEWSDAFLAKAK